MSVARPRRALTILPLAVLAIILGAAAYLLLRVPGMSEQLPANGAPLSVALVEPGDGEGYPASGAVPVTGAAWGELPVARVELWVDGALQETYTAPVAGLFQLENTWRWTPATLGGHTLFVRAYDSLGRSAQSLSVRLQGEADPGLRVLHEVRAGETVASLAALYGATRESVRELNPELPADRPPAAGSELWIPIAGSESPRRDPVAASTAGVARASSAAPRSADLLFWLRRRIPAAMPRHLPAAPSLQAAVDGCSVELTFEDRADNESGFFVYRLDPAASAFRRIATLRREPGDRGVSYTDRNLRGEYQYYVAAFNPLGETPGNVTLASSDDPECADPAQVYLLDELVPGAAARAETAYLYLSAGEQWSRVPESSDAFLRSSEPIHLGSWLGRIAGAENGRRQLEGEAWGWQEGALVSLGSFEKEAHGTSLATPGTSFLPPSRLEVRGVNIVDTTAFNWETERSFDSPDAMGRATFRWQTPYPASHGRWQVAVVPYAGEADLKPPGLVLTGEAPKPVPAGSRIEFPIPMRTLVEPPAQAGQRLPPEQRVFSPLPPFAPAYPSPGKVQSLEGSTLGILSSPFLPMPQHAGRSQGTVMRHPDLTSLLVAGVDTYYVRVLPMSGNQVAGEASNTVIVHYDPESGLVGFEFPPPPVEIPYQVEISSFEPTHFPVSKYQFCVEVVSVDKSKLPPFSEWRWASPGMIGCPEKEKGKSKWGQAWSDLGDLIKSAMNLGKWVYDKLDALVNKVVKELNPLCIGAKFAAEGEGTVDKVCEAVASVAVAAAKAYVGIPPSLPSYDQLTGLGKGYLVELAAEELAARGIPCPDECKEVLAKGLDHTFDEIKASQSNPACSQEVKDHGLKPICPPAGVKVRPDPRGQYAPALLTVRLSRPAGPEPVLSPGQVLRACPLTVESPYANSFWVGKRLSLRTPGHLSSDLEWKGVPLSGQLFAGESRPVPVIAPGASVVVPVALEVPLGVFYEPGSLNPIFNDSPSDPWLPDHKAVWKASYYMPRVSAWMSDWWIRYHGARLTVTASSCGNQDQRQAGPLSMPLMQATWGAPPGS